MRRCRHAGLPPQPGNEEPPGFFPTTPITDAGTATQDLYTLTFVIAVIVFALVEGLLIYITIRFRRRPTDTELPPQTHGSNPLEILWTVVPTITVTGPVRRRPDHADRQVRDRAPRHRTSTIDVTGFQWQWTFDYQDQGLSFTGSGIQGPVMAMPINETVRIRLHANDVIHSFYVPQFLYKKDVVPGRVNEFDVMVTKAGTYGGQCAEFCGIGHADMHFTVEAMDRAAIRRLGARSNSRPRRTGQPERPTRRARLSRSRPWASSQGFDPKTLTAPANQPFVVNLTNADPTAPHDFGIKARQPGRHRLQGRSRCASPADRRLTTCRRCRPTLTSSTAPFTPT